MTVRTQRNRRAGILLIDLVFYMALLGIVLILAAVVFNQFLIQSGSLRRNIDDIERALKAGERWRADLHGATGPVRQENIEGAEGFIIPQARGEIVYTFTNIVRRRAAGSEVWEPALAGVKSAKIIHEKRQHASGWRWEIELETRRKNPRVRPLFTFIAVPEEH
jgi:hypothetical protein